MASIIPSISSYPEEISKGVNPLVFVVNAIPNAHTNTEGILDSNSTNNNNNNKNVLFDTFLKAMEMTTIVEDEDLSLSSVDAASKTHEEVIGGTSTSDALSAILGDTDNTNRRSSPSSKDATAKSFSEKAQGTTLASNPSSKAKKLKNPSTKSFLERLRFISVSRKHAFPPSKDAIGNNNTVSHWLRSVVSNNTTNEPLQVGRGVSNLDINGILPSGWLEKHVHALPSCVMVVTNFNPSSSREEVDDDLIKLVESIDILRSTLAPKRECRIHLVCLFPYSSEGREGEESEYISSLRTLSRLTPSCITVLHVPNDIDLSPSFPSKTIAPALKRLHRTIRDASISYYLTQARRVKRKYTSLISSLNTIHEEVLFPLAVRYCFKIAIFYEFQKEGDMIGSHKLDKTMKYFLEAYRLMEGYFIKNAVSRSHSGVASSNYTSSSTAAAAAALEEASSLQQQQQSPTSFPTIGTSPSVEVTLSPTATTTTTTASTDEGEMSTSSPGGVVASATIYDMSYQCRTIADWLNYKILQYYISSPLTSIPLQPSDHHPLASNENMTNTTPTTSSDNTNHVQSIMTQWRRFHQIFGTYSSLSTYSNQEQNKNNQHQEPKWYFWKYISHSKYMFATLLQKEYRTTSSSSTKGVQASQSPQALSSNTYSERVSVVGNIWRLYSNAGEGYIRVYKELQRLRQQHDMSTIVKESTSPTNTAELHHRGRFVGALDSQGFYSLLEDEYPIDYLDVASHCFEKALQQYNQEYTTTTPTTNTPKIVPTTTTYSQAYIYFLLAQVNYEKKEYESSFQYFYKCYKQLQKQQSYTNTNSSLYIYVLQGCMQCWNKIHDDDTTKIPSLESMIMDLRHILLHQNVFHLLSDRERNDLIHIFFENHNNKQQKEHTWACTYPVSTVNIGKKELPIEYALTYPTHKTHATCGDSVSMILSLRSNISFVVCLKNIQLYTSLSDTDGIHVYLQEEMVMRFDNPNKNNCWNSDWNGILIHPGQIVFLKLDGMIVPNIYGKLSNSSSGGGGGGVGSYKYLKPKTTGLTRSAGACYLPQTSKQLSSPSLSLLGGIPWYCTGIHATIELLPSNDSKTIFTFNTTPTLILTYDTHRDTETANKTQKALSSTTTRSTTVADEESYVESAWSRPFYHPTSFGPRCLRILPPIPLSTVVDVTSPVTNGNLTEGVVNRIVLKLEAGPFEFCHNVQFRVICKHSYTEGFGDAVEESNTATGAVSSSANSDFENVMQDDDANNNEHADKTIDGDVGSSLLSANTTRRNPLLVVQDDDSTTRNSITSDGYSIPSGWNTLVLDQQDDYTRSMADTIEPAKSSHVSFELFRPLPTNPITASAASSDTTEKQSNDSIILSKCKTDYEVIFTYHQIRQQQGSSNNNTSSQDDVGNIVTLYHRGSYQWITPLTANFSVISKGPHKSFPCGNRHISNLVDTKTYTNSLSMSTTDTDSSFTSIHADDPTASASSSEQIFSAIDDESIRVRCSLSLPTATGVPSPPDVKHNHPAVFIEEVTFENDFNASPTSDDNSLICDLTYVPSYSDQQRKQQHLVRNTIFSTKCTAGPTIYSGTNFSLSYLVKPHINLQSSSTLDYTNIFFHNDDDITPYHATTSLGVISIHWNPIPIPLTTALKTTIDHGPLPSPSSCTIKFFAPHIRVEYAPFEAKLSTFPFSPPKVSTPFHITYSIKNKTPLHQKLSVTMSELPINTTTSTETSPASNALSPTSIIEKVKSDGILLSGFINGEITLSPHETKTFEYCILAIRAGCIMLPTLAVVSLRYKSWVVCDAANPRNLYILP